MTGSDRHSWGEPVRFTHKTERECRRCGFIKVTRHEVIVWQEFWRDEEKYPGPRTPPCDARNETASTHRVPIRPASQGFPK